MITDEELRKEKRHIETTSGGGYSCNLSHVTLIDTILSERTERAKNPGVWDGAPEGTNMAHILYYKGLCASGNANVYTRELPKTKSREIAEKRSEVFCQGAKSLDFQKNLADCIESAILEAQGKQS